MKISEKNKDKAEIEKTRIKLSSDLREFQIWAAKIIESGTISDSDEKEMESRTVKMDLNIKLFKKMGERYLLKHKEPPPFPQFNS